MLKATHIASPGLVLSSLFVLSLVDSLCRLYTLSVHCKEVSKIFLVVAETHMKVQVFIAELSFFPLFFCSPADHKVSGISIETDNKNVKAEEFKGTVWTLLGLFLIYEQCMQTIDIQKLFVHVRLISSVLKDPAPALSIDSLCNLGVSLFSLT